MGADDSQEPATAAGRRRRGLFADDLGVTVRGVQTRRFTWPEIARFEDGHHTDKDGGVHWDLLIVLHTGRGVPVSGTLITREALSAVRRAAERYGIPADLTGVPMTAGGRPVKRGLYEDPAGEVGLRYWDGDQWSPLVPRDVLSRSRPVRASAGSWSALPVADGRWMYAATRARTLTLWLALGAAGSAALLAVGAIGLWYRGARHGGLSVPCFVAAAFAGWYTFLAWLFRRDFLKLDNAANGSLGLSRSTGAEP